MTETRRTDGYAERSKVLLTQAKEELAIGDSLQALEKLWGAAAHMVKAVADRRALRYDNHRSLFEAVGRLAEETGDADLKASFQIANSLHTNFYEDWQPREHVEGSVSTTERFISRLERL